MVQVARKAKAREGTVVSDKMDKTVVVAVSSSTRHRLYKKIMRRLRRYMVHDETNDAKLGDRVRIVESRPYSRRKRWQLAEVLVRADRPEVAAEEIDLELLGEVKVKEEEEEPGAEARAEPEEPAEAAEEPETEAKEAPAAEGEEEESS
ncbi:MAG: 30S ribosomal protein S17 [Chloroflexi bacterium]|nr:30S ribosomal protein S17 [Chloroflexota bacterium]